MSTLESLCKLSPVCACVGGSARRSGPVSIVDGPLRVGCSTSCLWNGGGTSSRDVHCFSIGMFLLRLSAHILREVRSDGLCHPRTGERISQNQSACLSGRRRGPFATIISTCISATKWVDSGWTHDSCVGVNPRQLHTQNSLVTTSVHAQAVDETRRMQVQMLVHCCTPPGWQPYDAHACNATARTYNSVRAARRNHTRVLVALATCP